MRAGSIVAAALGTVALAAPLPPPPSPDQGKLTLGSPQIAPGQKIAASQVFNALGCAGQNLSPALSWSPPPAGTQSLALLVFDPDAPGDGWWHWIVHGIPAQARSLPEGAGDPGKALMPAGAIQERNDFGTRGYGGPCPPPGKPHRYFFWLYALKVPKLEVPADSGPASVVAKVRASALSRAELMGVYGR
jgi:Raf kinase inhibitor-like YbhB/YbcL family protein